jgi:hypothetical protein
MSTLSASGKVRYHTRTTITIGPDVTLKAYIWSRAAKHGSKVTGGPYYLTVSATLVGTYDTLKEARSVLGSLGL